VRPIEGVELYNRADYENAVGAFRNAVRSDPRDYRSQYYLGVTYERLNNVQQAIQSYKSALEVMKETPAGRDDVDFHQIVMNTLATAIAKYDVNHLEQDLLSQQGANAKLDSNARADAYFLLAKVERYRRDADSALQAYYKASEMNRDDFWLQKEAGLYLLQLGQGNRAVKAIQRANQLRSRDTEVLAAMKQLRLTPAPSMMQGESGPKTVFPSRPLPAVELKVGDPVVLPNELPVD
jgi:Flp pilus assembly protein TadD